MTIENKNMITIEKDEFTGLKKISSKFINFSKFKIYDSMFAITMDRISVASVFYDLNAFDLLYAEAEDGQGGIYIRIYTLLSERNNFPRWDDIWPFIIDGEKTSLQSSLAAQYETHHEFKIYNLPIDMLTKISNAKEVKYSLRGENKKVEGVFSNEHLLIFKAFEEYCFGNEADGEKILDSINSAFLSEKEEEEESTTYTCHSCKARNLVPNSWDSFNCHGCKKDNKIITPKELSDEERLTHDKKVLELIENKKIGDAITYYAANFGFSEADSKLRVKEIADKNGFGSNYKKYETKSSIIGFVIIAVVVFVLFKACS